MPRPSHFALLFTACLSGSCMTVPAERLPSPPVPMSSNRTWVSSHTGYVFRIGYFTRAELRDRRWERARRDRRHQAVICRGSERIVRRDVRWYEATPLSGRLCAAVVYTIRCAIPNNAPEDTLEEDRINLLRQDPASPIEPACGEKDYSRRDDPPPPPQPQLSELISAQATCEAGQSSTPEPVRVAPETRIYVRTLVSPSLEVPGSFGYWITRIPGGKIDTSFSHAHRIRPHVREAPVPDDGTNVLITQEFATDDRGGAYCVRLTARQGPRLWQMTMRRPRFVEHLRREVGVSWDGFSNDSERYWHPTTDANLLARSLGGYLVSNAAPDEAFRQGWE